MPPKLNSCTHSDTEAFAKSSLMLKQSLPLFILPKMSRVDWGKNSVIWWISPKIENSSIDVLGAKPIRAAYRRNMVPLLSLRGTDTELERVRRNTLWTEAYKKGSYSRSASVEMDLYSLTKSGEPLFFIGILHICWSLYYLVIILKLAPILIAVGAANRSQFAPQLNKWTSCFQFRRFNSLSGSRTQLNSVGA